MNKKLELSKLVLSPMFEGEEKSMKFEGLREGEESLR